jgi:hypothetical protein
MTQKMKTALLALALLCAAPGPACAQGSAGADATIESRSVIDVPTAGIIPHKSVSVDFDFFGEGGVLTTATLGLFGRATLACSFGGTSIIGAASPNWNALPGFGARIRVLDEALVLPAIALGFSSQGKGAWLSALDRYEVKSPGLYGVVSKNYRLAGYLAIHGGMNYSFERGDGDRDINFFAGAEKTLGPFLSFMAEYDLGMNDSNRDALGRGRGYFNTGLKVAMGNGLMIALSLRDVFQNQQDATIANRTIQIEYVHLP